MKKFCCWPRSTSSDCKAYRVVHAGRWWEHSQPRNEIWIWVNLLLLCAEFIRTIWLCRSVLFFYLGDSLSVSPSQFARRTAGSVWGPAIFWGRSCGAVAGCYSERACLVMRGLLVSWSVCRTAFNLFEVNLMTLIFLSAVGSAPWLVSHS
jgi:hypothetical protein